jgi:hypothetical protein
VVSAGDNNSCIISVVSAGDNNNIQQK